MIPSLMVAEIAGSYAVVATGRVEAPTLTSASWSAGRFLKGAAVAMLALLNNAVAVTAASKMRTLNVDAFEIVDIIGSHKGIGRKREE